MPASRISSPVNTLGLTAEQRREQAPELGIYLVSLLQQAARLRSMRRIASSSVCTASQSPALRRDKSALGGLFQFVKRGQFTAPSCAISASTRTTVLRWLRAVLFPARWRATQHLLKRRAARRTARGSPRRSLLETRVFNFLRIGSRSRSITKRASSDARSSIRTVHRFASRFQ